MSKTEDLIVDAAAIALGLVATSMLGGRYEISVPIPTPREQMVAALRESERLETLKRNEPLPTLTAESLLAECHALRVQLEEAIYESQKARSRWRSSGP